MENNTLIIAGFPGIGKSYLKKQYGESVSDSDSSKFPKDEFPQNYIKHLKSLIGKKSIILVSTHKVVLNGLENENIPYILAHPKFDLKNEYLERYKERGSPTHFIELLKNNWNNFFEDMNSAKPIYRMVLGRDQYLKDKIDDLRKR
jgi:hypothetical protein